MKEMKPDVSVAFTPDELAADGRKNFNSLIEILMSQGFELRIRSDGYCTIVEGMYNEEPDGKYEWVDEDHVVVNSEKLNDYVNWDKVESYEIDLYE